MQDAAKLAVEQATLLKSLGIDGIIIGNTRFLVPPHQQAPHKDEYGGSLENRMRFIMDVCRAVKAACGPDFIISTNITVPEAQEGGWTLEDAIEACKMLEGLADLQDGSYRVLCGTNVEKMFDYFDEEVELDATTVNGWVVLQLDKAPRIGDTFEYEVGNKVLPAV